MATRTLQMMFFLVLFIQFTTVLSQNNVAINSALDYKKCTSRGFGPLTLWLLDGWCTRGCSELQNCTTFFGNIIVRPALTVKGNSTITKKMDSFPALREITGYLIVVFLKEYSKMPYLFPNLAVIRGRELFLHYALVYYRTELEKVNLPSLTVIESGGVRIDHNDNMCYVETVRWSSIVLENTQTRENFGLVFNKNNKNCYDKCYSRKCFAPSGHGNTRRQYCWGPGSKTGSFECQTFCKGECGPQGCVRGTVDQCCHPACLGGCTKANSDMHCFACKKYRTGNLGKCVNQCPPGKYVIENFECASACPFWNPFFWSLPNWLILYYNYKGHCVLNCPAGYVKNRATKNCDKCLGQRCPRVCTARSGTALIEGLSDAQKYKGCTEIRGNISIVLRAGPDDIVQKLKENLGLIETVKGYIVIRESEPLTSLSFFENLVEVLPKYLYEDQFAIAVSRNSNLKSLWKPKTALKVSTGKLFFHTNQYLCPKVIKELQSSVGKNRSDALWPTVNGYMALCNVKKFNISVYEVKNRTLCKLPKCVNVTWYHDRVFDSRNLFYSVNYRVLLDGSKTNSQIKYKCGNIKWEVVDVFIPKVFVNQNNTNPQQRVEMFALLKNLSAYLNYSIYVEIHLHNGDGMRSDESKIQLSESIPRRPLALEASYLSSSEIKLKWNPPDLPNGVITDYQVFYKKNSYLFWNQSLGWCQRDVTHVDGFNTVKDKNNTLSGRCLKNGTCNCDVKVEESRQLREDRNSMLFQMAFEDKIFASVFSKPSDENDKGGKDGDKKKKGSVSSNDDTALTTTQSPNCSAGLSSSNCQPLSTTPKDATTLKQTTTPGITTTKMRRSTTPKKQSTTADQKGEKLITVDGKTFQLVLKSLSYFQEYKIRVCPCNKAGCGTNLNCAVVFGRTDVNTTADNLPATVKAKVTGGEYNISWDPPPQPNGIVLRYDVGIRHNQNMEIIRCHLATWPTFIVEKGVAPGNYTIRIRAIAPVSNGSWTSPISFKIEQARGAKPSGSNAVVIGIGSAAACVIFLLVIVVVYYAYVKKTAQMGVPGVLYASVNPEYLNSNEVYIPDEWEVPREKVELIRELGKGSFGMVYEGIAYGILEDEQKLRVAVKTVNENASIRDRIEFLQEASIMKAFNCNHIVRLLGVVSQGQPTLVVMELMERGDLKTFLRNRRPEEKGGLLPPSLAEVLQMAAEIADGMSYLAARKFVHRDLAARNCMVAADFTVKIGDFGMTRDIYETDYYRKGGKGLLPVRWMAPESLKDGIFTTASDVWSYGVVLWEMATLAAQPYPGKSNEDVLRFVIEGGVLEQPDDCSDRLYNMMSNCWKTDPRARPSFLETVQFLENDVNDSFEEVSYYHEMKRKLLEATETTLLKGPDQVRHNSVKMASNMVEGNARGSVTSDSAGEEDWKTEADQGLKEADDDCNGGRSKSMYDNDGDAVNMRYVELPSNGNAKSKKSSKPVPV
eukprot:gene9771-10770_t